MKTTSKTWAGGRKNHQGVMTFFSREIQGDFWWNVAKGRLYEFVSGAATLWEARKHAWSHVDDGDVCPCCGRWMKINYKPLNASMAYGLCWLVRNYHGQWVHLPTQSPREVLRTKQLPTLKHWGMVEARLSEDKKLKHEGYWRPTDLGVEFAHGNVIVPGGCYFYDDAVFGFSTKLIHITDALNKEFNYEEIMGAPPVYGATAGPFTWKVYGE